MAKVLKEIIYYFLKILTTSLDLIDSFLNAILYIQKVVMLKTFYLTKKEIYRWGKLFIAFFFEIC